jgi:hypothetical protein
MYVYVVQYITFRQLCLLRYFLWFVRSYDALHLYHFIKGLYLISIVNVSFANS